MEPFAGRDRYCGTYLIPFTKLPSCETIPVNFF